MAFWFPFIQLLGVQPSVLLEALTHRKIETKTEEVKRLWVEMYLPSPLLLPAGWWPQGIPDP